MMSKIHYLFNRFRQSAKVCIFINILGLLILFLTTLYSVNNLIYDEPWYLRIVNSLHEKGLSVSFLKNLPGPPGPLHTIVHYIFEPLTNLEAPGVRLVNNFLLIAIIYILFFILKKIGSSHPFISATSIIGIPIIWVLSGMALTEIPAILFVSLSILFLLLALNTSSQKFAYFLSFLGGLSLGISVLGRQPFLALIIALPILAFKNKNARNILLIFFVSAIVLPLIVFFIWGGIVPPKTAKVQTGISIINGLFSYCYAAIMMLILAPKWFSIEANKLIAICVPIFILNLIFGYAETIPMLFVANKVLSPFYLTIYGRFVSSLMLGLGVIFLISTLKNMWQHRNDTFFLFLCLSTLLLLGTSIKITHQFSSRYTATAAPLLLLIADRYSLVTRWKAVRVFGGGFLGCLILLSYFNRPW